MDGWYFLFYFCGLLTITTEEFYCPWKFHCIQYMLLSVFSVLTEG